MDTSQGAVEFGLREFGPSPCQVSCSRRNRGAGDGGGFEEVAKRSEAVMEGVTDLNKRGCVPQLPGMSEMAGNTNCVYTIFSPIHTSLC